MIKTPITHCSISARLLVGSSMALALACISQVAHAQSFQANADVVAGDAIISTGANVTDIQVNTSEVVINWTPTDTSAPAVIDFQPIGTTANFFADSSANFTVLNRIIPVDANGAPVASAVAFNGTVNSYLLASVNNPGGNIWFYSPTGIIVGATGVFNVGSLILTTNDITFGATNTGGSTLFGPAGEVFFRGPVNSSGFVQIDAGAQINALGGAASYIALVAPRLVQAGTVSADGSIAYVAAEELDVTINAGLFDINILTGTTDLNGLVHTGTTTGPASIAAADRQIISMVALPKNAMLTMLLGGSVGYTPAAVAANDGSAVILSAGYDGFDAAGQPLEESPDNFGNIDISDAVFSNRVEGFASGRIDVSPAGGSVDFASDVALYAQQAISMVADVKETITVGGALALASSQSSQGGTINLIAQGGVIDAATSMIVDASSNAGRFSSAALLGGVGGTVNLLAEGAGGIAGSVSAPLVSFRADGLGTEDAVTTGGSDGLGGTITLTAGALGTLSFGSLFASAKGIGGLSRFLAGGDGIGGDISLLDRGGLLALGGVSLFSNGSGGVGQTENGAGFGGRIVVDITSQAQDWVSLLADASAFGANPSTKGALGGRAIGARNAVALTITGPGSLNIQQGINLAANAISGIDLAPGQSGAAGGIVIDVLKGGALTANGLISAHADARIAATGKAVGPPSDSSPDQFGGTINVSVSGGTITASEMMLSADSESASAIAAGDAFGGSVALSISDSGTVALLGGKNADVLELRANAFGYAGISSSDAFAGLAKITIDGGTLDVVGNINVLAIGDQGLSPFVFAGGFDATGGSATVEVGANGGALNAVDLNVVALGSAGLNPANADAGDGRGGTAKFTVNGGSANLNIVSIRAEGLGGTSGPTKLPGQTQSGDGFGGTAVLSQTAGAIKANQIFVSAQGTGGGQADPGSGTTTQLAGNGFGGVSQVELAGGTLSTNLLTLSAIAFGGQGNNDPNPEANTAAGDGGVATGGVAELNMSPGSTATLTSGATLIDASAFGGAGGTSFDPVPARGDGGSATGGTASASVGDGSFDLGATQIVANGTGGDGETGGNGSGGISKFTLQDTVAGTLSRAFASLMIDAKGVSGAGGTSTGTTTAGTTVIDLTMLDPASRPTITGDLSVSATGAIAPAGDGLTAQVSGGVLSVGGNVAIDTTRDVSMTISPGAILDAAGTLDINARTVTATGLIVSGGDASIIAPVGIAMTDLSSGGATLLQSTGGPVSVTNDLSSAGLVTATGTSIDLRALSTLNIADVQASAGDIVLTVDGATSDLIIAQANATGAVTGSTADGSIAVDGPVSGSSVTLIAGDALTANGDVTATTGAIQMIAGSALNSIGALGAATDVTLDAATALTQDGAIIAGGDASLTAGTDLVSNAAVSGANVSLAAGADLTTTNTILSGGSATFTAGGDANLTGNVNAAGTLDINARTVTATGLIVSGGDASIIAPVGIAMTDLSSGGATLLQSTGGPVSVTNDLSSAGLVTATGTSIDLRALSTLNIADVQASAGDIVLTVDGATSDLIIAQANATGAVTGSTADGSIAVDGPVSGSSVTLIAGDALTANGDVTATTGAIQMIAGSALNSIGALGAATDVTLDAATALTQDGAIIAGGDASLTAGTDLVSNAAVSGANVSLAAGADLTTTNTILSGGSATFTAGGDANLTGNVNAAGTLDINARTVTATGLIVSGGDASIIAPVGIAMTDLSSGGATLLQSTGGPVSVTNDLSSAGLVTATGTSIDLRALSTLNIADVQASAGDIVLTVDGATSDLIIAQANATGAVTGSTADGSIAVDGPVSGSSVTLIAGDALTANGDVTATTGAIQMIAGSALNSIGALGAATDVTLDAATALTQDGAIIAGGDASLTAGTDLVSNAAVSGANVTMNAGDALASTGNVTATSGAIQMIAGSALNSVGVLDAATDVTLDATTALTQDGAIVAGGDALLTAGTDIFSNGAIDAGANVALAAGADLATTNDVISGGSATFTVGGDASIFGDVFAATDADFIAGGGLAVDATVIGTRINGTSSAIDLGAAAQLGVLGITQSIALTNSDAVGNTFVGGADVANSYSLTQAELGRIAADNSLTVSSTGSGLFSLGDFTVATGIGGSLGDGGTLALLSAGDLFVAGMARLATGDPGSTLQLKGQQVVVSANTGSLKISDAATTLSGVLQIESQSLIVAGSAALADLASAADLTEASDRLGVADGTPTDDGYLQARSINISATDRIFIQNSGAGEEFVDRRGFTAGALNIDTASPATQIAINGVILSAGSRVTGLETQPLVTINGSSVAPGGRFDPLSTINGCIIGLACRLQIVPLDPLNEDQLKGVTPEGDPSGGRSLVGGAMVIEIRENKPLVKPPLIDEPITGVGNDDLWLRPCDSEADVDCPVEEGVQ